MSNFTQAAYHPPTGTIRAALWLDNYFGSHQYGVTFVASTGDERIYKPEEVVIPTTKVFVERTGIPDIMTELLSLARCPHSNCHNGTLAAEQSDGNIGIEPCIWCHQRIHILNKYNERKEQETAQTDREKAAEGTYGAPK